MCLPAVVVTLACCQNFLSSLTFCAPGISWNPDGTKLAVGAKVGGQDGIYLVKVESGNFLTDTNAAQNARALRLNLTGTSGGARNLIVPAIAKQYIVNNGLADAVTVKNSSGTGIAVAAGKTMLVFNNATNVVDVTNYLSSLALGAALPIASGGTNGTSSPVAGAVPYGTGTAYAFTAAGTAGQVLTSNGASAPTWAAASGGITTGKSIAMAMIFGF
jgi:hypothetical protein